MSSFKLNPGSKEINSEGTFAKKATNTIKQFAVNAVKGALGVSGLGAGVGIKAKAKPKKQLPTMIKQEKSNSIKSLRRQYEYNQELRRQKNLGSGTIQELPKTGIKQLRQTPKNMSKKLTSKRLKTTKVSTIKPKGIVNLKN